MKRDEQEPQPTRKPYEAPCVLESGSFERLVLACAKSQDEGPGMGFCPGGVSS